MLEGVIAAVEHASFVGAVVHLLNLILAQADHVVRIRPVRRFPAIAKIASSPTTLYPDVALAVDDSHLGTIHSRLNLVRRDLPGDFSGRADRDLHRHSTPAEF